MSEGVVVAREEGLCFAKGVSPRASGARFRCRDGFFTVVSGGKALKK